MLGLFWLAPLFASVSSAHAQARVVLPGWQATNEWRLRACDAVRQLRMGAQGVIGALQNVIYTTISFHYISTHEPRQIVENVRLLEPRYITIEGEKCTPRAPGDARVTHTSARLRVVTAHRPAATLLPLELEVLWFIIWRSRLTEIYCPSPPSFPHPPPHAEVPGFLSVTLPRPPSAPASAGAAGLSPGHSFGGAAHPWLRVAPALLDAGYQVRVCLIQALHYGHAAARWVRDRARGPGRGARGIRFGAQGAFISAPVLDATNSARTPRLRGSPARPRPRRPPARAAAPPPHSGSSSSRRAWAARCRRRRRRGTTCRARCRGGTCRTAG